MNNKVDNTDTKLLNGIKVSLIIILWLLIGYLLYILRDIVVGYRYQSLLVFLTIIFVLIVVKINKSKRQKFLKYTSIILSVLIFFLLLILLGGLSKFGIIVHHGDICVEIEENSYNCYNLPSNFRYSWDFIPYKYLEYPTNWPSIDKTILKN